MNQSVIIDEFRRSWEFARQLTEDFVAAVPHERWGYSPHPRYAPLCKQFRHMIWVTGLYREALQRGDMQACSSKKTHYSGGLTRDEITAGMREQGRRLDETLGDLKNRNLEV